MRGKGGGRSRREKKSGCERGESRKRKNWGAKGDVKSEGSWFWGGGGREVNRPHFPQAWAQACGATNG